MSVVVRIPTPLRRMTNGQEEVSVEASNLMGVLDEVDSQFPGFKERLCDSSGEVNPWINIFLNGEDVRPLQGLDTAVRAGDEVSIVPAMQGG